MHWLSGWGDNGTFKIKMGTCGIEGQYYRRRLRRRVEDGGTETEGEDAGIESAEENAGRRGSRGRTRRGNRGWRCA